MLMAMCLCLCWLLPLLPLKMRILYTVLVSHREHVLQYCRTGMLLMLQGNPMLQVEQAGGKRQTSVSRVFLQTWFIENAPTTPAEQAHTPHGGGENYLCQTRFCEKGVGGESCEKGREAKPHRDEHQEQATARGAEPKIPS